MIYLHVVMIALIIYCWYMFVKELGMWGVIAASGVSSVLVLIWAVLTMLLELVIK